MKAPLADCLASALMPVEVFVGGLGHVVLCQEWTTELEDRYLRIVVPRGTAKALAASILELVEGE